MFQRCRVDTWMLPRYRTLSEIYQTHRGCRRHWAPDPVPAGRCQADNGCTGMNCPPPTPFGRFRWGIVCTGRRWSCPCQSGMSPLSRGCSQWTPWRFDRCLGRTRGIVRRRSCQCLSGTSPEGMTRRRPGGSCPPWAGRFLRGTPRRHWALGSLGLSGTFLVGRVHRTQRLPCLVLSDTCQTYISYSPLDLSVRLPLGLFPVHTGCIGWDQWPQSPSCNFQRDMGCSWC